MSVEMKRTWQKYIYATQLNENTALPVPCTCVAERHRIQTAKACGQLVNCVSSHEQHWCTKAF